MCGFAIDHIDVAKLTEQQKQALKSELERRKQAHQDRVRELEQAIAKIK
jgi:hypothetical protein